MPIDVSSGNNSTCDAVCNFSYDYGNSSCSTENKKWYVKVNGGNGDNKVSITGLGDLDVISIKLFKPSLNKYDGQNMDGELIIEHLSGTKGANLFVCIPLKGTNGENASVRWFRKFVKTIPTNYNSGSKCSSTNVVDFTLNDVIPKGPYFYVENVTMREGRTTNEDRVIMFDSRVATRIGAKELKALSNIIKPIHEKNWPVQSASKNVFYNRKGTEKGPGITGTKAGDSNNMTCYPVNEAGEKIEMEVKGKIGMGMLEKWSGYVGTDGKKIDVLKTILPFIVIIASIIFVFACLWLYKKMHSAAVSVPVKQITTGIGAS